MASVNHPGHQHIRPTRRVGLVAAAATLALVLTACSEPPLAPNEILVTYDHGETCKWTDWAFRYRRGITSTQVIGNALKVGPENQELADDTTLRVFSNEGEKLTIAGPDIRAMRFAFVPDPDNSGYNEVALLTIDTAAGPVPLFTEPLPKFSRSRVLVPVASHYFPAQSDDYMSWGNVRLMLVGTAEEGCSTDRVISLTRPEHPQSRTPAHIKFPGG